jgi:hypothetical protein
LCEGFEETNARAHLTNTICSSVTYVTQDGIWTAFSHPLPLFHMDSGSAPYVSHATSFPCQPLSTFDFLPPSSILTLIKMLPTQKQTTCLYSALPGYPLPLPTTNGAVPFPCQSPSLLYTSPTKPSQSPFFPCTSPDDHLPNPKPFFQTRSLDLHGSEV